MKKMKKLIVLFAMVIRCSFIVGQETEPTEEGVDLLKAPSSPAAQLLNFAHNSIERPTDLSSFWLSINNATSNFTQLPTSYAVDFFASIIV